MAYTTIDNGSEHFNTVLWSGDGNTGRTISGVGFQPDWTWIKRRGSSTYSHALLDSNRGGGKALSSDNTDAENTNNNILSSWNSDGFVIALSDVSAFSNTSGHTYVGWNWKANGGTTSSNTDGSITSTVQANTTAGFSIVTYTGTGSNATVGHGLGKKPNFIFIKDRDNSKSWVVYNSHLTALKRLNLDTTSASVNASEFQDTEPTTSVFSIATDNNVNGSSQDYVAYCFAEIEGYSKFGSYTGNGSSDGTFIYTGFRPAWLIGKRTDGSGNSWFMFDNKRDTANVMDNYLYANESGAENTGTGRVDFLSNGFKWRNTAQAWNGSSNTYIYMAFAENPFVSSSGVPVIAR